MKKDRRRKCKCGMKCKINEVFLSPQLHQTIAYMKDIYTKARICPFRSTFSTTCELPLDPGKNFGLFTRHYFSFAVLEK